MVTKAKFLVVVSILEGRNFPKRPKHCLLIEARFDGELLGTDLVAHVENPDFTQELAWELDKKGLHQHRMQRTSIKVLCYAIDNLSTMKEPVGYVMLDLRSAQTKQMPKWYSLLHGKYTKSKPEIRLSIYIDEDTSKEQSFRAREAPPRRGLLPTESSSGDTFSDIDPAVLKQSLKPVLHEDDGFYQLGPADKCSDFFTLSITIAFAANLPQLIPSTVPLPSTIASGYFFYYSLMGNDVTNEPFFDLVNPSFPAERASVRIRSNVDALRLFFTNQPGLQVHLCCGDQSLGSTDIPLKSLLKKDSTEIFMRPVSIEGAFSLSPPNRWKEQLKPLPEHMQPTVGVSVVLRREDKSDAPPVLPTPHSPPEKLPKQRHPSPVPEKKVEKPTQSPPKVNLEIERRAPSPSPRTEDEVSEVEHDRPLRADQEPQQVPAYAVATEPHKFTKLDAVEPGRRSVTPPHLSIPPPLKHFSFSADLIRVRNLQTSHPINVFLRYSYPFFGSPAPVMMTHPSIEIFKGTEVTLPQSYCVFDFATTDHEIQETFSRVPLVVEVRDKNRQLSQDILFGVSQLPLKALLAAELERLRDGGVACTQRRLAGTLPILAPEGEVKKIGELDFIIILSDLGPMQPHIVEESVSQPTTQPSVEPAPVAKPVDVREGQEYQAAMELEMWKEAQEQMFTKQLKEHELKHMKALAEEWKKRDHEREVLFSKKLSEYSQLEEQLRKAAADLSKRETEISGMEKEVTRLKTDLKHEHERKMLELKEASVRVQEECEHKIQLERAKTRELEDQIQRLRSELNQTELRYQSLDREFSSYKEQQSSKPEVRLQSEINLLTLEKVELERKVESISKSKLHYKQQWGKALKELARLKEREQMMAKKQLKKQQDELEHMRLRYLAAEEKELVQSERHELEDIRKEIDRMKELQQERVQQVDSQNVGRGDVTSTQEIQQQSHDWDGDEHISRLIEERDTLLRTGVYTNEDRIIAELDRQIREAIARKGR